MFTGSFMGLAYLVASKDSLAVFGYFTSCVTIFGSLIWVSSFVIKPEPLADRQICILSSHIGFMRGMKAQGIPRTTLPFIAVSVSFANHSPDAR